MGDEGGPLKIREAADRLGVDYGTIRGAIEKGLLPATRQEGSFRIRPEDLLAYRDRLAAELPDPGVKPPAPPPPASKELDEAREFAARARRWVRRPAFDNPQMKDETGED